MPMYRMHPYRPLCLPLCGLSATTNKFTHKVMMIVMVMTVVLHKTCDCDASPVPQQLQPV